MRPTEITIRLSEIAGQVDQELTAEAEPLADQDAGQIVERVRGRLHIVDGFHRTAGQARYCDENGIDQADHVITVVLACEDDDNDLVSDAASPGPRQQAAIAEIYRLAGRK